MGLPTRNEVNINETWDLTPLFADNEEFYTVLDEAVNAAGSFNEKFNGKLNDPAVIIKMLDELAQLEELIDRLANYASLLLSVDQTNTASQKLAGQFGSKYGKLASSLSFVNSQLLEQPETLLEDVKQQSSDYARYIDKLLKKKPHQLHPEVEKTLAAFSSTFSAPYGLYDTTKMLDIDFGTFEADGKEIPMSYVSFEGELEVDHDTETRRKAFRHFSDVLAKYQHTTAKTYDMQVQQEKTESQLRGYDSVIDYLLADQEVSRELYNRQIDTIMNELAPHMRRYAALLKRTNKLDTMKFEDLKISLDESYEPDITVEESREYIHRGLSVLGEDYMKLVDDAYDKRYIDFVQNKGKSTGAFCASPYTTNPFILISWTSKMTEVFVLAHELGHAGHFDLAQKHQNIFNSESSLYFVEAPSTMNEMLMANHLLSESDDPQFKRWVIATIIARTYYHNFVTHLLEAAYQREVYHRVDNGENMSAEQLNEIKQHVLNEFWGDSVEMTKGAELTWMRQPHYYMGLYPYTYSAGLTIATLMSQRIQQDPAAVNDWLNVLKAGGSLPPVELTKMAGIDLTTDAPLKETIAYIGSLIDQLEKLTDEIENNQ